MVTTTIRLDKLLSNLGYGSRREIQALARNGRLTLDGAPLLAADQRLTLGAMLAEQLKVDGKAVDPLPGLVLMLHKPLGVTCSHKDVGPLVFELLPERWRRRDPPLSSIGRLDKETSGLLLLTDDGALLHRVIAPKSQVSKRYLVTLDRPLTGQEGAIFASGDLRLEDDERPLLPAQLQPLADRSAYLTLSEGRYHQVRRMFAAVGNHVNALHRDRIGGLDLPSDLPAGGFRALNKVDIARLFSPLD